MERTFDDSFPLEVRCTSSSASWLSQLSLPEFWQWYVELTDEVIERARSVWGGVGVGLGDECLNMIGADLKQVRRCTQSHIPCVGSEVAMRSCGTWRLKSFLNPHNMNFNEQAQTGNFLDQMEGDLPGQANVNDGYIKLCDGVGTIGRHLLSIEASGIPGEVRLSTSVRHNYISYSRTGTSIQSPTSHRGQRNPRRGTTPSTNAYFITTLSSNFTGQIISFLETYRMRKATSV
ncbi:uncharacterized protein LACBIDRAFT_333818 [Laccaria bicolor S238N-H82]|uniref:Predicted protein n=1 Tax=Laccaria bicolor (strain S238N-H82 / ATCC MYA-4686) TaxID=486041 RepID=B0DX63_LACBS|nr:uncharacterized protein LACBIDRAFT_333818 [Laccaria bicolor S238N-H82]EDR00739.1 predicted protein [Laccaria bicolor S238N-H82]|eukprot:XP_001888531.1 predicted protein [Laccaria bicolor S238N-H82]